MILDNDATHKHAKVRAWLARHPRFHLHFTPTASLWLNLVERFFADLTADVVREGSFGGVPALVAAIEGCLAERNLLPKPFRRRAKGADILAKLLGNRYVTNFRDPSSSSAGADAGSQGRDGDGALGRQG